MFEESRSENVAPQEPGGGTCTHVRVERVEVDEAVLQQQRRHAEDGRRRLAVLRLLRSKTTTHISLFVGLLQSVCASIHVFFAINYLTGGVCPGLRP